MSSSRSNEQQDSSATAEKNLDSSNNVTSDYNQNSQNDASDDTTVETNKEDETSSYETVYTEYGGLGGDSATTLTTTAVSSDSTTPASYQQLTAMSPSTTITSAGQFEHITVMTKLQQPLDVYTDIPISSASDDVVYTLTNPPNTATLQICPPSAITQQVQQSVPALNTIPPTELQNRLEFGVQRLQTSRGNNNRAKTYNYLASQLAYPVAMPVVGRGVNKQIANIPPVAIGEQVTVRQPQKPRRIRQKKQPVVQGEEQLSLQEQEQLAFQEQQQLAFQEQHRLVMQEQQQLAMQEQHQLALREHQLALQEQQQMAIHEKLKARKEEFVGDYSRMLSVSAALNLPVSGSVNMPLSAPMSMPASPTVNIPMSPSMNAPRVQQIQRQPQYIPRSALQKPRVVMDRGRRMPVFDNQMDQTITTTTTTTTTTTPSYGMQRQRLQSDAELHEEAFQRAAAVYNHIKTQKYLESLSDPNQGQYSRSPAGTSGRKKSPTRKRARNHSNPSAQNSASQIRVTVLGSQSQPETQEIITESDRLLPIHGIASLPKQPRTEITTTALGREVIPRNIAERQQWQFVRPADNAVPMDTSQTMAGSLKPENRMDPTAARKAYPVQIGNNSYSMTCVDPMHGHHGTSIGGSDPTMISGASNLAAMQQHMHTGNARHVTGVSREPVAQVGNEQSTQAREAEYERKLYFLKRLIESLVIKNGALCDEVSRLNQRIRTVTDERRMLAKRVQHHERKRIRRIQNKLKKQAAAKATKPTDSQAVPASTTNGAEEALPPGDAEIFESDDSDKTFTSSGAATPTTVASMSRVETPEPTAAAAAGAHGQESVSKLGQNSPSVQDGGKCKLKNGVRRQYSAKRIPVERKEKKVPSN